MVAGLEVDVAEEWIFNTLSGDATLKGLVGDRIFNTEAPQTAAFPFVIYQNMSAMDYAAVGAVRIWTNQVFMVKVVGDTVDYSTLKTIVARIDALLHRSSGSTADGTVWAVVREQILNQAENVNGHQYRHRGGLFRVMAT
jgi:hypothetical protein